MDDQIAVAPYMDTSDDKVHIGSIGDQINEARSLICAIMMMKDSSNEYELTETAFHTITFRIDAHLQIANRQLDVLRDKLNANGRQPTGEPRKNGGAE